MKRSKIIWRGVLLGFLAVIVPLGATSLVGWLLTVHATQDRLNSLAQIASQRASTTFDQASQALRALALTDIKPCTPESIHQMRLLAMNTFSVESVGYEEDVFACTCWGPAQPKSITWPEDFITHDGVKVSIDVLPDSDAVKPMMALQYAAFNVLVDPEQFQEVVLEDGIRMAIGTRSGRALGPTEPQMMHFLSLVHSGATSGLKDGFLYALVPQGNWLAVAAIPRGELLRSFWAHQFYLLPIGLLLAAWLLYRVAQSSQRRLSPLAALERAVRRQELQVNYQPIIEIDSGHCVGAEALLRWQRPDGSWVPPDQFIPLAEESGLILPITDQLIRRVMDELGPLLREQRSLHVALNLAAADICSGRFLPLLEQQIANAGVLASQVWLEVTERGFIDAEAARATIGRAREAGFMVALDDFGTGYSSLQYLQQLPLDALKIDKSFVERISTTGNAVPLIAHVIEMSRSLGLKLIAEGVESIEQLAYLRAQQVEYVQGWLFAKALAPAEFEAFYRARELAPTAFQVSERPLV